MIHVNTKQFRAAMTRKLDAGRRASPRAAEGVVRYAVRTFAREFVNTAPRDTGRFANGVAEACRSAGVTDGPSVTLRESPMRPLHRAQLTRQAEALQARVGSTREAMRNIEAALLKSGYTGRPRPGWRKRPLDDQGRKWTRRLEDLRILLPAYERLYAKAVAEIAKFEASPYATVFGLGRGGVFAYRGTGDAQNEASRVLPDVRIVERRDGQRRAKGLRLRITVRGTVYGGDGRLVASGGRVRAVLRNREAHARFADRRSQTGTRALHAVSPEVHRIKPKVARELARAMDVSVKA